VEQIIFHAMRNYNNVLIILIVALMNIAYCPKLKEHNNNNQQKLNSNMKEEEVEKKLYTMILKELQELVFKPIFTIFSSL